MKKVSAVEWLAKELLREHPILTNHDAIQQAKEMEKEQNEKSFHLGRLYFGREGDTTFEQYYTETFKK